MTRSAYNFGLEDGKTDKKNGFDNFKESTNPYDENTPEFNDYVKGYCDGYNKED